MIILCVLLHSENPLNRYDEENYILGWYGKNTIISSNYVHKTETKLGVLY
jgi:hypothetical protein